MSAAGVVRLAAGVVVAAGAVTAAAVVGVPGVDLRPFAPVASTDGTARAQTVAVTRAGLVCPGPESIGVRGTGKVGSAPTSSQVAVAAAPDVLRPTAAGAGTAKDGLRLRRLPGRTLATNHLPGATAGPSAYAGTTSAAAVAVQASGADAAGLVADQWSALVTGDQRGLWSAPCTGGAADTWLVGGGTDPGRRGRVVLANPGANPVDVALDVLGAKGRTRATAGSTVAVPGHGRVVVLLDAIAPGVVAPVVHVRASGGVVAATLQDAVLNGTVAAGIDDVVPGAAPSRRQLVPGVAVDGGASLRVAAPGHSEAVAQVRLVGPSGDVEVPGGGVLRVPAGSSRDVDLDGLRPGTYTVQVQADVPVVAGAFVARRQAGAAPREVAWAASATPLHEDGAVAGTAMAPPATGWSTSLALGAPGGDVQVDVVTGDGRVQTMRLPGGTTRVVPVDGAGAVWVRTRGGSDRAELSAARVVQVADGAGPLLTSDPLQQVQLTERRPAVEPGD